VALWTLIESRWPELAGFLEEHPDRVAAIGSESLPHDVPRRLQGLFGDPQVVATIHGDAPEVEGRLGPEELRALLGGPGSVMAGPP
jgi:hypothetical protein